MTETRTETWNRTHARKVAGKVMADLRQMSQAYGQPSPERISEYLEELETLLAEGYLKEVTYGFKQGDEWVVALKYKATEVGLVYNDDYSGMIPRGKDVSRASWYSFLAKSDAFFKLTPEKRRAIEDSLPIKRSTAEEPSAGTGWHPDKTYNSGGGGVRRSTLGAA